MSHLELPENMQHFINLRNEVAAICSQQIAGMPENPDEWSGKHIQLFIENASEKLHARISERWVYTYFKKEIPKKLPREDMLDILAKYTGKTSWRAYLENQTVDKTTVQKRTKRNRRRWIAALLTVVFAMLIFMMFQPNQTTSYFKVCLLDAHTMLPAQHTYTVQEYDNLMPGSVLFADSSACITLPSVEGELQLIIVSPYYVNDTITISTGKDQTFVLQPDKLAILLQFFVGNGHQNSPGKLDILEQILHPELKALAIEESSGIPIALYNKKEFARKLLLRGSTAGRINIVYLSYKNDQIYEIRYLLPDAF